MFHRVLQKMLKLGIAVFALIFIAASTTFATDADSFICGRMREASLADLKAKLLENCNLDKPFSLTRDDALSGSYLYCCNKKK